MRLLPQWLGPDFGGFAGEEHASERRPDPRVAGRSQMPLRHPRQHSARGQARGPGLREAIMNININRRGLLAGTGALVVSVGLPGVKTRASATTQASRLPLKPDQLATYI